MKAIYSIFCLCISLTSLGQTIQTDTVRRFIDGNYYDLTRIVKESEQGYTVNEYFPRGGLYQTYSTAKLPIGKSNITTGKVIKYNLDGTAIYQGEKKDGKPVKTHWWYYPSGSLMTKKVYNSASQKTLQVSYFDSTFNEISEEVYFSVAPKIDSLVSFFDNGSIKKILLRGFINGSDYQTKLLFLFDKNGNKIIYKGNGDILNKDESDETLLQGSYVNGLKVGMWKERIKGVGQYEDYYSREGKLLAGTLTTIDGKAFDYTSKEKLPSFIGGRQALYQFIATNLHYPKEAKDKKLKGQVILRYTVSQLGEVNDIKVVKSVHPLLDEEAIRVVKLTNGKWEPGFQRGRAVRVLYSLPVNFRSL